MTTRLPAFNGYSSTSYQVSLNSGEKKSYSDICTRRLNGDMSRILPRDGDKKEIVDLIRFRYEDKWEWSRGHIIFLRALFRGLEMPEAFTIQLTVNNLNDRNGGLRIPTHLYSGPIILLAHSLIRDLYEAPRRYWVMYGLWRKGMNAVDAYNTAGKWEVSHDRGGALTWREAQGSYSQAIPTSGYNLSKATTLSLMQQKPYKETARLKGNPNIMESMEFGGMPKPDIDPSSLLPYAYLFGG